MDSTSPYTKQQLSSFIIQPFPIQFDCNDYHIIIFFDGHPEYESIEAMIQEREGRDPYIRAIITYHSKTQVDYINDRDIYNNLKSLNINRKIYYTTIHYTRTKKCFKSHFLLKFNSIKNEEVILDFYPASKPSAKYAKLVDPFGHSITTSLPVMHPVKSTLIGAKSKVFIKGVQYNIPVNIHVPIFFTGLKGFYSEIFNIGIIRAGNNSITLIKAPTALKPGEEWIYKSDNKTSTYKISNIEGNIITIKTKKEKIELETTELGLALKDLYVYSSCKNYQNAEFSMHFSPSINIQPVAADSIQKRVSQFSISINNYKSLITGVVEIEASFDSLKLLLKPIQPTWAMERNVFVSIQVSGNNFFINTEIIKSAEK